MDLLEQEETMRQDKNVNHAMTLRIEVLCCTQDQLQCQRSIACAIIHTVARLIKVMRLGLLATALELSGSFLILVTDLGASLAEARI